MSGELDIATSGIVRDAAALMLEHHAGDLRLDLSATTFIDASGLGAIVAIRNLLAGRGRDLVVAGATARIRRTFDLGGLHQLLTPP